MADDDKTLVPVWTLAPDDVRMPAITDDAPITPERLAELRGVLAALADCPIATLEVHPLPEKVDRSQGIVLDSTSPLAHHLSQLIVQTMKAAPAAGKIGTSGETLYRMIMPAKVAAQLGKGLVRPMVSTGAAGGIRGALVNSSGGIAAQASFKPVTAQPAVAGVAGAGALTVAAPLMLMAVAAAISAYEQHQRKQAIDRITDLLEKLHEGKLEDERSELEGCRAAIDTATAIVLDEGRIGAALGLDASVFFINKAIAAADRRLRRWRQALDRLPDGPVEIAKLTKAFPGVDKSGGEFRAHLELAALAIALKRRVIVLQAVDQAQRDRSNPFTSFVRILKTHQQHVDELQAGITGVLRRLSALKLTRPRGLIDMMFTPGEVDDLLSAAYRLRELGDRADNVSRDCDVAIDIARSTDGSVIVFPALAA